MKRLPASESVALVLMGERVTHRQRLLSCLDVLDTRRKELEAIVVLARRRARTAVLTTSVILFSIVIFSLARRWHILRSRSLR